MYKLKFCNETHQITKDITKIGRHTQNDIIIHETRASRFHCQIIVIDGRIFLKDNKTINGTFIGNTCILPDREILLKPDDQIGIGGPAGELKTSTIFVVQSSDEPPSDEDNEVVSTTNDSNSYQNLANDHEDDEYREANRSREERLTRPNNVKRAVAPLKEAQELEKKPLIPQSTVSKPADPSSSRQSKKPCLPQVKSEPGVDLPEESIPSSASTNLRIKQPPADDCESSVSPPSAVNLNDGAASALTAASKNEIVNNYLFPILKEFINEKLSGSDIIPMLMNISNHNAAQASESSTSQASVSSPNVNKETPGKALSQPTLPTPNVSERTNAKTDSKEPNVISIDVPAAKFMKVDLCDELENDMVEIADVSPVASPATDEAASRVPRRTSNNDDESVRKQSHPPESSVRKSRKCQSNKRKSSEAIINLCDVNEGPDDVIMILSDDESGSKRRISRRNRKIVDPNTIVIEDVQDDDNEVFENLSPSSDKPVVTTATATVEVALSSKRKVDLSEPVEIASIEQPSSSNQKLSDKQQVRFAEATATTSAEPSSSSRRKISFQQPTITSPVEYPSIDEPMLGFSLPKVSASAESSSRPKTVLKESVTAAPSPAESPISDLPPIYSFDDPCEDVKPVIIKGEVVAQSNYSNMEEIITLDSDDEDFPLSQLNTTQINDMPDFSSTFERMFDDSDFVKGESEMLQCNENTWFEPFSQTEMVEGKHVTRIQPEFDCIAEAELDGVSETEENRVSDEEPDGVAASEQAEAGDRMKVDEEPSLRTPSSDVNRLNEDEQPQSPERSSYDKRKYNLKECSIVLTDAQPLKDRRSRKAPREAEKEKRRKSLGFDEYLMHLDENVFKNAAKKKRTALLSPQKKRKRIRTHQSPPMTVQDKILIKQKRREKLKEIAPKTSETETKWKDAFRPDAKPVVKVTEKNRGSFLIETMIQESSLPKRDKPSKAEPSTSKHRIHSKEGAHRLPVQKEKVPRSNDSKSNDDKLAVRIFDMYCVEESKSGSSRPGSACEQPATDAVADSANQVTDSVTEEANSRKQDEELAEKSTKSTASRGDACVYEKFKSFYVSSQPEKPKKSNMKKTPLIFGPTNIYDPPKPKKKVRFQREHDCKFIVRDAQERRNNGSFAPAYKLNESLIREGICEFESALAKVCSWNVKWLEEQQKCFDPPPLYIESAQMMSCSRTLRYKEELKVLMFNNLWQAIFHSWNKPDNDFLPHTQYINERTSLSTLNIESVDTAKEEKKLWSIMANRTVPADDIENDLTTGQIVILNFPIVREAMGGMTRKTMVFGYVSQIVKTFVNGNQSINQRMGIKIFAKAFHIKLGEAKIKVLNYLKSCLRPFHALAMVTRSPLTDLIIDPNKKFSFDSVFDASGDWFHDIFLDSSQRRAVANCLNCIFSPEPSLCLVNGTPGTGKSQVIVSLMRELFSRNHRNRFPHDLKILIVTAVDVIADDLSYRLEALNKKEKCFNFLRYGNCRGMHFTMKNCTLDKKIQDLLNEDQGNKLISLEEEKNNLKARIHSIKLVLDSTSAKPEKINEAKLKLTSIERELNDMENENSRVIEQLKSQRAKEISIESADVVLTSIHSCWTSNFETDFVPSHVNKGDVHKFTVCIFDDASLINETAMLVPIMLMVRSLIMIGDRRNQIAINKGTSPFTRLLKDFDKKAPSAVTDLNCQYRSPPYITQWVNDFYDIKCKQKYSPSSGSKSKIKSFFVLDLLLPPADDIIYRYETQANYCSMLLEKLNELEDTNLRFGVVVAQPSQKDIVKGSIGLFEKGRKVIVDTLEEFSGREQDVVILCLPYHCLQYASWLYVAVTRARFSLFVCGDFRQLESQKCVHSLAQFAKSHNLYSQRDPFESDIPNSLILSSS